MLIFVNMERLTENEHDYGTIYSDLHQDLYVREIVVAWLVIYIWLQQTHGSRKTLYQYNPLSQLQSIPHELVYDLFIAME